ncbi:hypothetical protein FIBSPDRAFT_176425 [Athelia psychrophila]|uniref:Uncharacterized protein n=1 Tax=Athelia psychrophila TaxID=1759441 RepID=A0A166AMK8_9AGAM|nr:hypothetical protein FIBSPDRAFT_176425 [Fibularhizoctonia sp. CBS 109695]
MGGKEKEGEEVSLSWRVGIPEQHVVCLFIPDGKMWEWDLVRVLAKNERGAASKVTPSVSTPADMDVVLSISTERKTFPGGVDGILTPCAEHYVRSSVLDAHSHLRRSSGPP